MCAPNETKPCYTGPAGTQGIGLCAEGVATCTAAGDGFGPCVGDVVPAPEDCATAGDESCDGAGCGEGIWSRALGPGLISASGAAMDIVDWLGGPAVAGAFLSSDPQLLNGAGLLRFAPDGAVTEVRTFQQGFTLNSVRASTNPMGGLVYAAVGANGMNFGGAALSGFVVASFDAAGGHAWSRSIAASTTDDFVTSIAQGQSGDVAIVGVTLDGIDFGNGQLANGGFIATLSGASGALLTSLTLGPGSQLPAVAALPSGRFAVAFSPDLRILEAGTGLHCAATLNVGAVPALAVLPSGDILLAHGKGNTIEVVKVEPNCAVGTPIVIPAQGATRPRLGVGGSGDFFVSWGTSMGHVVTRRTAAGAEVWTHTFASSGVNDQRLAVLGGLSPIVVSLSPSGTIDYGDGAKPAGVTVARIAP